MTHDDTRDYDDAMDYEALAAGLDRWRDVPTEVLRDVVMLNGLYLRLAEEPDWDDCAPSDGRLAAQLCAGCSVIGQCLELDLRTAGACTSGVWGALAEDDRRALHRVWQRRRRQHDGNDQEGATTP
ncbi:MAG: WhiB family transcriptional regulator [Pseudonocardiaceae bacterium]